jgi:hypothetical protein
MAMAPVSLLVVAGEKRRALKSRAISLLRENRDRSPANQVQREGALPDDTCRDRSSELSAMEAK